MLTYATSFGISYTLLSFTEDEVCKLLASSPLSPPLAVTSLYEIGENEHEGRKKKMFLTEAV